MFCSTQSQSHFFCFNLNVQDVEGVVDADGTLTVVQTRPQM